MRLIKNITAIQEFKQMLPKANKILELSKVGFREANQIFWFYNITPTNQEDYINLKTLEKAVCVSIENIKKLKKLILELETLYEQAPKFFDKNSDYQNITSFLPNLEAKINHLTESIIEIRYFKTNDDLIYTLNQLSKMQKAITYDATKKDNKNHIESLTI